MHVAIVIPALNEAQSLPALLAEIEHAMAKLDHAYQVLVVDDGSTDQTAQIASENGAKVLRSAKNAGKSAALQAGFDACTDVDAVITMDADLQDDPAEIPRMLDALQEFDVVSGWKVDRRDSWSRRVQSRLFGSIVRRMTGIELHDFNCGFKAYRREVLDNIALTGDQHRLIPVLAVNAGFSVGEIAVNHRSRQHGTSRFGFGRAFAGPMDLLAVLFLTHFGEKPLRIFGGAGLTFGIAGFLIAVYLTWLKIFTGAAIGERPLLLLAILLLIAGLQLFAIGLIGEMLVSRSRTKLSARFRVVGTVDSRGVERSSQWHQGHKSKLGDK